MTQRGDIAYSRYVNETKIDFKSLKPGTYELRILVDENNNGVWDSADFAEGIFAEPVYIFEKKIEVRPLWEIRETWELPENSLDSDSTSVIPVNREEITKPLDPEKTQ